MHGLTSVHTGLESHTTEQARAWQLASIAPYLCCCWGNPRWWAATPGWLVDLCDCVTHTKHILPTNHTSRLLWDCRAYLYRAYRRHRHSVTKQGVLLCDVHPTDEAWEVQAGTAFILRCALLVAQGRRAAARAVQAGRQPPFVPLWHACAACPGGNAASAVLLSQSQLAVLPWAVSAEVWDERSDGWHVCQDGRQNKMAVGCGHGSGVRFVFCFV